jgi:hypothetical protein
VGPPAKDAPRTSGRRHPEEKLLGEVEVPFITSVRRSFSYEPKALAFGHGLEGPEPLRLRPFASF